MKESHAAGEELGDAESDRAAANTVDEPNPEPETTDEDLPLPPEIKAPCHMSPSPVAVAVAVTITVASIIYHQVLFDGRPSLSPSPSP